MELRTLRYFMAVVEKQNFTRAAESLNMAQPPLSQQIRKLEETLGTPLLRRLTRSVELTEAGESLYRDAAQILALADAAKLKVKRIARGEQGALRIGFAGSTVLHPAVLTLLHDYRERYPEVALSPQEGTMPALVEALRNDRLDAAILRLPCRGSEGFAHHLIEQEPLLIALPTSHPKAKPGPLPLASLKDESFILFPHAIGPGLYDGIVGLCREAGFEPILGPECPQVISTVGMVQAGFGVTLVPRSVAALRPLGVSYHPIEGNGMMTSISLATRPHPSSAVLRHFIAQIRAAQIQQGLPKEALLNKREPA
ncbi:LysR family transcriptional regulator [Aeromonas veronii]|uniref:LysR family transcriptional regulator n=1 Tax=Aeromonas veronii TaxID=654 RepID=UPI000718548B|nr:LysR family transcriptional regulator [Aeromonas veronii]KRV88150.1 transcriptional regulator [Aeromonas veronii]KRV95115.1 transcriptional regulator [Aeromonas veronii]KRW08638.1 transcriptional regulator [Aeromonas veronii]KRW14579.1 transcriptional regulator [Aeromonas veronii]KRW22776.1 transcriptional regulator [Aeromonas veronii]